jgi:hypothetical protein
MTDSLSPPSSTPASSAPPSRERIVLLGNASMRARRRPIAVLFVWLYELLVGVLLAAPIASYVKSVYGAHPDGDGPLWADGGLDLISFLADARHAISGMISMGALVLFLGYVVSVVPLALLLMSIAHTTADLRAPPLRQLWPRVVPTIPPLLALLAVMTVVEALLAGAAFFVGGRVGAAFSESMGDARADQIAVVATLFFLLGAAAAGVVHDLARAAVIRFRQTAWGAIKMGARTFARKPSRLLWSWMWRSGASLIPAIAAAALATRIGARSGLALFALFLIHQAVIVARVALRASWLARALRAVDSTFHVVSQRSL